MPDTHPEFAAERRSPGLVVLGGGVGAAAAIAVLSVWKFCPPPVVTLRPEVEP